MATNNPTDVPVDALSRQCNNESIPPLLYSSEGIYIGVVVSIHYILSMFYCRTMATASSLKRLPTIEITV